MMIFALVAQVADATSASGLKFNWTISLGDIAQAMSLPLSLAVAWLTIKSSMSQQNIETRENARLQREAFENNAKLQRELLEKTLAEQRALTFLNDLLSRFVDLSKECEYVAETVKKHYTTKPNAKWKETQATVEARRKACDNHVEVLKAFLSPSDADSLTLAFNKWYDAVFCGAWPLRAGDNPMQPGDGRLKDLEEGHVEWSRFIMKMKQDLLKVINPPKPS